MSPRDAAASMISANTTRSVDDVIVVGGGIVGLATAYRLLQARPGLRLRLVEKESQLAAHQSSRNSGVIHSGLYYKPGSKKAGLCLAGYHQLIEFCRLHSIPYELCGKVVVATTPDELPRLDELYQRGRANGLQGLRFLSPEALREREPNCAAISGLIVPQTGIINYQAVARKLAQLISEAGGVIQTDARVDRIVHGADLSCQPVHLETSAGVYRARCVVACAGLQSDRLAILQDPKLSVRIVPFRGEYYQLKQSAEALISHLIYPVPDPSFPFLGVHFTRLIGGGVECGPNAVLALAREGYSRTAYDFSDLADTLLWPGFRTLALRYWKEGLNEIWRSWSKPAFVRALQRLVPAIREDDLIPGGVGIRAQACDREGKLVDDFVIREEARVLHVCNAPSPAATASLAIGTYLATRTCARLDD